MENRRVQQYGRTGRAQRFLSVSLGGERKMELEPVAAGVETELSLSLLGQHDDDVAGVAFPIFGGSETHIFRSVRQEPVLVRQLPVKRTGSGGRWRADGRQRLRSGAGGLWNGSWSG